MPLRFLKKQMLSTINDIWVGWYSPPNGRKIRGKNSKSNQYDLLQVLSKSSWTTLETIFKSLSALGACNLTIIGEMVCKKSTIFEVFWECLREFLIFLHEIFFGSKILTGSWNQHHKFDCGCSSYPGNEAQSFDFGRFLTILGIFRAVCFDTSL